MLRVVLKYTDCLQDGRNVFRILTSHNVEILRTCSFFTMHPKVTIRINDNSKLNDILYDLNNKCSYEVSVIKIKKEK